MSTSKSENKTTTKKRTTKSGSRTKSTSAKRASKAKTATRSNKSTAKRTTGSTRKRIRATKKRGAFDSVKNSAANLALLPYQIPFDVERAAIHGARVGGFAFVLFGMIFTYNYLETTVTDLMVRATQQAQVTAAPCDDACADAISRTPAVSFSYAADTTADTETITLDVPKAKAITVYAYETKTGRYHKLGAAEQIEDDTWIYIWDTSDVTPGEYWIKAVITNRYGVYDRSDSTFITVE